jgi:hypothetical protein
VENSVANKKENKQQPNTSQLRLRVLVNGKKIFESEDSVGEVDEESQTIVALGWESDNTHHSFPTNIQILPKPSNHLQPSHPLQPSLRLRSTKRVSPTTSLSTRVKRAKEKSTKKTPIRTKITKLTLNLKAKASLKPKPPNLPKHLPFPNGEF